VNLRDSFLGDSFCHRSVRASRGTYSTHNVRSDRKLCRNARELSGGGSGWVGGERCFVMGLTHEGFARLSQRFKKIKIMYVDNVRSYRTLCRDAREPSGGEGV
jgi:hypothetical protein